MYMCTNCSEHAKGAHQERCVYTPSGGLQVSGVSERLPQSVVTLDVVCEVQSATADYIYKRKRASWCALFRRARHGRLLNGSSRHSKFELGKDVAVLTGHVRCGCALTELHTQYGAAHAR
jgi:hypothetical protein